MTDHNARQAGLIATMIDEWYFHADEHVKAKLVDYSNVLLDRFAAHSADARNGEGVGLADRLLAALERASAAESSLRALVDECDNDSTPGWEERMAGRIAQANRLLAAPAAPAPRCTRCEYIGKCDCEPAPAPAAQARIGRVEVKDGRVQSYGFEQTDIPSGNYELFVSTTPTECTCPSGNGSLRHPCPVHPADAAGEADKRDAERYRWLAEHITIYRLWTRKGTWFCAPNNATEAEGYESVSAAIDAAIQRERQQGAV
ncbi:hypothetical protein [Cupriavidus pauculus]|uniref:hypothetical protein n=1 Tax=Cupriavidus pauculus TaxID=82633 RepID=UPI000783E1DD|nr:hypothetical protein [Cupriavidus pauculus]